jgi:hypothetical protein
MTDEESLARDIYLVLLSRNASATPEEAHGAAVDFFAYMRSVSKPQPYGQQQPREQQQQPREQQPCDQQETLSQRHGALINAIADIVRSQQQTKPQ